METTFHLFKIEAVVGIEFGRYCGNDTLPHGICLAFSGEDRLILKFSQRNLALTDGRKTERKTDRRNRSQQKHIVSRTGEAAVRFEHEEV